MMLFTPMTIEPVPAPLILVCIFPPGTVERDTAVAHTANIVIDRYESEPPFL